MFDKIYDCSTLLNILYNKFCFLSKQVKPHNTRTTYEYGKIIF